MEALDGRRRTGANTRSRLLEATADALARCRPGEVSMRAVTAEAKANVAAVKYHFGNREALIEEVLAAATSRVTSTQSERMDALEGQSEPPSVRAWLEAWAGPLVAVVVSDRPDERRLGRIITNALSEPTALAPRLRDLAAGTDARLVAGLSRALDPIDERELWLRLTVMASATAGLGGGTFDPLLERAATADPLDVRLLDLLEWIVRAPAGSAPQATSTARTAER